MADVLASGGGQAVLKSEEEGELLAQVLGDDLSDEFLQGVLVATEVELGTYPDVGGDLGDVEALLARIGGYLTQGEVKKAEEEGLSKRLLKLLKESLLAMFILGKGEGKDAVSAALGDQAASSISTSLTLADKAAVAALAQEQLLWIGGYWSNSLAKSILGTVAEEAVQHGFGRVHVGRVLRAIVEEKHPQATVPPGWKGSRDQYFEMLAGTVKNRAVNYGRLASYRAGGIVRYTIRAVLDERTSEICREMDGTTFDLSEGEDNMNSALGAKTPDEFKEAVGWRSVEEIREIRGSGSPEAQARNLAAAGLALPPYHGSCRTVIVPD